MLVDQTDPILQHSARPRPFNGPALATVVALTGLPGSGKSTQAALLQSKTDVTVVHLVKVDGVLHLETGSTHTPVGNSVLAPEELSQMLVAHVVGLTNLIVVLDGVPRTVQQAVSLHAAAREYSWRLCVIELVLPVTHSAIRQGNRSRELGHQPDFVQYLDKLDRAVNKDSLAVHAIEDLGVVVHRINAQLPVDVVHNRILGLLAK